MAVKKRKGMKLIQKNNVVDTKERDT